jgi:hypothetical protein
MCSGGVWAYECYQIWLATYTNWPAQHDSLNRRIRMWGAWGEQQPNALNIPAIQCIQDGVGNIDGKIGQQCGAELLLDADHRRVDGIAWRGAGAERKQHSDDTKSAAYTAHVILHTKPITFAYARGGSVEG